MSDTNDDDDRVGYGRPPKAHQFKPGRSGKPSGRPRGALGKVTKTIQAVLAERAEAPDGQGGVKKMSLQELAIRQLVAAGLKGDLHAIERVLGLCAQLGALKPSAPATAQSGVLVVEGYMSQDEWEKYWKAQQAAKRRSKRNDQ